MGVTTTSRGDVQGLRAVAVLAVVVAHAGVPFLPGGFVGRGRLLRRLGLPDLRPALPRLAAGHGVPLARFWARRARRILPAATVVLLTTLLAGLVVLPLLDGRSLVDDALWAGLFVVNVHFARQDDYFFSRDIDASPLQHYWSLAVEEQFYVVWPLLLLGCVAVVRAARTMRGSAGGLRAGSSAAAGRDRGHAGGADRRLVRLVGRCRPPATRPRRTSPPSPAPGSSASAPSPRWSPRGRPGT